MMPLWITPRWGYGLMGRRAPRLTPGVIEIASLRDASSMVIHGNSGLLAWHHPLLI
jgi:hypothetical protein